MSIEDVKAFDDYEFSDAPNYKPLRNPLVTISREAWNEMQEYIQTLESDNEMLIQRLQEEEQYAIELEEHINALNSERTA